MFFIVLLCLRVVADLAFNMDEFVAQSKGASAGGQVVSRLENILIYYRYQSLVYIVELGGIIIVASAAFTLARMNHTNELTAMLASGVSLRRVLWPIVLCAIVLDVGIMLDQEFVIPRIADQLVRTRKGDVRAREVQLLTDAKATVWYAQAMDREYGIMRRPEVLVRDKSMLLARLSGLTAVHDTVDGEGGWLLRGGVKELTGPLFGRDLDDLLKALRTGNVVVRAIGGESSEDVIKGKVRAVAAGNDTAPASDFEAILERKGATGIVKFSLDKRDNALHFEGELKGMPSCTSVELELLRDGKSQTVASLWKGKIDGDELALAGDLAQSPAVLASNKPWNHAPTSSQIWTNANPGGLLAAWQKGKKKTAQNVRDVKAIKDYYSVDPQYGLEISYTQLTLEPWQEGKPRVGRLVKPRFAYRDGGRVLGIVVADHANWVALDQENGGGFWQLENGSIFYPTDLTLRDVVLRQSSNYLDFMSTSDLAELVVLRKTPDPNAVELARNLRFTDPINNVVMLLLGLPFILSRERNIKASASLCLLMVATFYVFMYICRLTGLPPMWGAWLPALLFGPVAAVMLDSVKT